MGVFENIRTIKEWVKVEKIRGDEALALCPFHNDTNPSLHINIPRLLFHCFSCGKGGRLTSDTKSPTPTYEHFASIFVGEEEKKAFEEGLPIEYKHFDTDSIYLDYLFSRGLSIQTIKHFRLGYCTSGTYADRIIVPLEKGFVARTIHNEILAKVATGRREKYLFPLGLNISEMLFNKGKYDPIILCEGVFDVMRLYEIGYDAIGLFGARVYPAQIESSLQVRRKRDGCCFRFRLCWEDGKG